MYRGVFDYSVTQTEFSNATDSSPMSINLNCKVVFFFLTAVVQSAMFVLMINRPVVGGQKMARI